MKRYNIIFTTDSKILLSSVKYQEWYEIQNTYEKYMASLDFETLDEVIEYLIIGHKLTRDKSIELMNSISVSTDEIIQLDF